MKLRQEKGKEAFASMELSTFHIPPCGEILVLGKRAPVGPEGAKRMLDSVSPGQFEVIKVEDAMVEAILIKAYLFKRADKKALIAAVLEEASAIMSEDCMLRIKCDVLVSVKRAL